MRRLLHAAGRGEPLPPPRSGSLEASYRYAMRQMASWNSLRLRSGLRAASASSRPVVCAFDGMLVRSDALGSLAETAREVDAMFEAAEGVSAEAEAR